MAYIGKSPSGSGVRTRYYFTQTSGGGTSISGTDDNGKTLTYTDGEYMDVYLNGVLLVHGTDYGTGTANTISSLAALANGDVVEVVVYDIYNVAKINNEAVRKRYYKTASGSETSISGADDSGATITFPANAEIEVKLNGVALVQGTDYNTTTANTVGGLSALSAGQVVEIVVYERFVLGDTVSKADGGTFLGNVGFSGTTTGLDLNGTELILDADADTSITADTDDRIDFKTGGTDRVHISSTGVAGLGIGTTDPDPTSDGTAARAFLAVQGTQNRGCLALGTTSNAGGDVSALRFNNGSNVVASIGVDSDSGSTTSGSMFFYTVQTQRMKIENNGNVTVPNGTLTSRRTGSGTPGYVLFTDATDSGYGDAVSQQNVAGNTRSSFIFHRGYTTGDNDNQYNIRGDGNAFIDGSWSGGGADYAEYFEWSDGNSSDEDRRGYSVVLDGNKIRKATANDAAASIIGVCSGNPTIVGDNPWDHWVDKYLRDDLGGYIYEPHTVTRWTVTNESGETTHHDYNTDRIPSGLSVPDDATVHSEDADGNAFTRKKRNPAYNEEQAYTPREERQEWDTIGLMGKLRLRAGQPTGDRWIKMRDIATDDDGNVTVEEWLVR